MLENVASMYSKTEPPEPVPWIQTDPSSRAQKGLHVGACICNTVGVQASSKEEKIEEGACLQWIVPCRKFPYRKLPPPLLGISEREENVHSM